MSTFDLGPVRALRPDERDDAPVVGLGEFWSKTWDEARHASNFDAHLKNYSDAFDGIADRVKAATGDTLDNPFRSASLGQSAEMLTTFSREAVDGSTLLSGWRQRVRELQAKHADKLDWDNLIDEPGRVAFATMKKAREEADALSERAGMIAPRDVPVVGGVPVLNAIGALGVNAVRHPQYTAAQLAAGFAAQMTSPADAAVNLISFGVGGAAKSIIKNATMNALSNAAGQALLSGPKQLAYQSAGLPYGWQVWADEVGAAAGAGFALDAAIRTPVRAAVNRFGPDTAAGMPFSRNTPRGGLLLDAVTDATPTPRVQPVQIDPETIRKAEAGDVAASREILEKTGALSDPTVKYAIDHLEAGGKLSDDALRVLESMGVARSDGMRMLADAVAGRMPEMPEPVRQAAEPFVPERGAPLLDRLAEVGDQITRLPARMQEAVADGLEAGIPGIVRAVEEAFQGPRETFAERVAQALDARSIAASRLHGGRASAIEMAQSIRQFPDLIDDAVPLEAGRIEQARAIARLDGGAFDAVVNGAVPPEVAAMVASRVPQAQQARVIGDIEKARPGSLAEAADLVDTLTFPERAGGELAPGARIVDPTGPEAKAHTEALKGEVGPAYEEAMAPIRRRDALESEIETKKGQVAKLERDVEKPQEPRDGETAPDPMEQVAQLRSEIRDLEAELAQLQGELDPSPGGQELYRVAMRSLALRRETDITLAVREALAIGRRMVPEGTRIDVLPDDAMQRVAGDGTRYQLDATSDAATGHIQLAIAAIDPAAKVGHEAVHTLVTLGHLSPAEVDALAALGREAGTFTDEAKYREAYKDRPEAARQIEEEAAASYIEARIKGAVEGPANTVVERIRQLMERIKRALAGYGFQSREDIVQAIMSGDAARREARAEWARAAQAEGRTAMQRQMADGVELPDGTRINGVKLYAIRAFHGSPHDFDRFSLDKIGTGEGAQAYGHGLYFAENEGVAKSYRDDLSKDFRIDAGNFQPKTDAEQFLLNILKTNDGDLDAAIATTSRYLEQFPNRASSKRYQDALEVAKQIKEQQRYEKVPGKMYEVSIKANPEDFLDWDKPVSQQPDKVKQAVNNLFTPTLEKGDGVWRVKVGDNPVETTRTQWGAQRAAGRISPEIPDTVSDLRAHFKSQDDLTKRLREAGIPGIKYLDQGSRAAGDGSRNYVVFDDNLIEIVAKDGQPVSTDKLYSLARQAGATPIDEIGPNDPHPGRVLAFHGTGAPIEGDTLDVGRSKDFGVHFGNAEQSSWFARGRASVGGTGGNIMPAVLDLKNVVTMPDQYTWRPADVAAQVEATVPGAAGLRQRVMDAEAGQVSAAGDAFSAGSAARGAGNDALRSGLTALGIDGIRYPNGVNAEGSGWSYIVWEPGKVISATSGDKLYSLRSGDKLTLDEKIANTRAIDNFVEKMPREQRRQLTNDLDVIVSPSGRYVHYDIVKAGEPLWSDAGDSNSMGSFIVKPAQRVEVSGVEVTNANLRLEDMQRKGIGTAIYDMVEKDFADFGGLSPSPYGQLSDAAKAFWKKRLPDDVPLDDARQLYSIRSDLDMSPEARKQRAEEMGFDTSRVLYHGTGRVFDAFDLGADKVTGGGLNDQGVFLTPDPKTASRYARDFGADSPSVIPVYVRARKVLTLKPGEFERLQGISGAIRNGEAIDEVKGIFLEGMLEEQGIKWDATSKVHPLEAVKAAGYDAIEKQAGRGGSEPELMVFDPKNIRSVNAEFNPSRSDSPNLMYAIRSDDIEPSLKQDMAIVDRMNRIGDLIQACRA